MPLPGPVAKGFSLGGSLLKKSVGPLAIGYFGLQDYRDRVRGGQHPLMAAGSITANQGLGLVVGLPTFLAVSLGPSLIQAGGTAFAGAVTQGGQQARLARTPFSQRFEHTAVTSMLQAQGMARLHGSWAHSRMGSEASAFAQRYGRR